MSYFLVYEDNGESYSDRLNDVIAVFRTLQEAISFIENTSPMWSQLNKADAFSIHEFGPRFISSYDYKGVGV